MKVTIIHTAFMSATEKVAKRVLNVEGTGEAAAEAAFLATNHPALVDTLEDVTIAKEGRCYPLSVGDFVSVGDSAFLCTSAGWLETTKNHMIVVVTIGLEFLKNNPGRHWEMRREGVQYLKALAEGPAAA